MARTQKTPAKHTDEALWHANQVWNWLNGRARVFLDPDEREVMERAANQVINDLHAIAGVLSGEFRRKKGPSTQA